MKKTHKTWTWRIFSSDFILFHLGLVISTGSDSSKFVPHTHEDGLQDLRSAKRAENQRKTDLFLSPLLPCLCTSQHGTWSCYCWSPGLERWHWSVRTVQHQSELPEPGASSVPVSRIRFMTWNGVNMASVCVFRIWAQTSTNQKASLVRLLSRDSHNRISIAREAVFDLIVSQKARKNWVKRWSQVHPKYIKDKKYIKKSLTEVFTVGSLWLNSVDSPSVGSLWGFRRVWSGPVLRAWSPGWRCHRWPPRRSRTSQKRHDGRSTGS